MNGSRSTVLSNIVMLFVVMMAIKLNQYLPAIQENISFIPATLISATGLYAISIKALFFLIPKSETLMQLYWGKLYLKGYWSYEYSIEDKTYFGIWTFDQDLDSITVVGSGLTTDFKVRTTVRSVSPLISEQGAYFFLNMRQELGGKGLIIPVFSKTTLYLDIPKGFKLVTTMRATTEIYGGVSSGQSHPDVVFRRHCEANSDEDVISLLKSKYPLIDLSTSAV
jgi:hypothetical protein